ncbi:MAG: CocE/NonD family hydrolase, partial [Deltaproteobacteria bacterium]|nr:CocE/NonD family hydrolase [Deltaproteobacteria bacterium]
MPLRPIATTTIRCLLVRNFCGGETGPIEFYVGQGYAYANMDVRGCGKSGGEFRLLDRNEQKDLYNVIEWLGHQPWSNRKVGGIGQSYFCMLQWWMAIQKPPSLACIAAFDGMNDPVGSKNSSEARSPFMLPPDGNSARVRPVARGIEHARRSECSYPEGTAGHCP